jgi:hypothetical protein
MKIGDDPIHGAERAVTAAGRVGCGLGSLASDPRAVDDRVAASRTVREGEGACRAVDGGGERADFVDVARATPVTALQTRG